MCTVCGCGQGRLAGREPEATTPDMAEGGAGGAVHASPHHHHHDHGANAAGVSVPGLPTERLVEIETAILAKNDVYANANRARLAARGSLALNFVSSPGSGKTTLLCATIAALNGAPLGVIEGDQQTQNDAERIRATGAPAVQINTGKGCHLDGHMIGHALEALDAPTGAYLFIENVGNLVCPAAFDLGEDAKVAVLSVTEGEDKPLKYPDIFTASRLAVINKIDLAEACAVDLDLLEANLRRVNPRIEVLRLSARTGEGLQAWLAWLERERAAKAAG